MKLAGRRQRPGVPEHLSRRQEGGLQALLLPQHTSPAAQALAEQNDERTRQRMTAIVKLLANGKLNDVTDLLDPQMEEEFVALANRLPQEAMSSGSALLMRLMHWYEQKQPYAPLLDQLVNERRPR
jgi:hypothetical protein